ncbi:DUF4190 domain-containing protein [Cellulomonas hominis]
MSTPPTEPERPNPFAPPVQSGTPAGCPAPPPPSGYEVGPSTTAGAPPTHPTMAGRPVPSGEQTRSAWPASPGGPTTPGWPGDSPYVVGHQDDPSTPYSAAPHAVAAHGTVPYGAPYSGSSPYGGPTSASPPYGTAAPGASPYGVPGYGYPPPGAWAPAPPPMDGLAIASLVTSGAGVVSAGLTGPVGLGLGIAALRRIRRTGARGRGLAIAGVVVGAAMTLLLAGWVALVVWGISTDPPQWSTTYTNTGADGSGSDTGAGTGAGSGSDSTSTDELPWFALDTSYVAGDCLELAPETYDFSDAVRVDCAGAHEAEVIGLVDFAAAPSQSLTSDDPALEDAALMCSATATALVPGFEEDGELWFDVYFPHPSQWGSGETWGYCVLGTYGAGLTGSATAGTLATVGTEVES